MSLLPPPICVSRTASQSASMDDSDLHALFCEWATWCRTKRLYAPSPNPQSVIGSLVRLPGGREGNARLDQQLASLHMAILGAGRDGYIISVEYLWRPYSRPKMPVKRIASALGFSRQRWYQLVKDARRRVYAGVDKIAVAPACQIIENVD